MSAPRLFAWCCWIGIAVGCGFLLFAGENLRYVMAPGVAVLALTLLYLAVMTRREGHLPIFEAATFFVLATAIYTFVPLLQFTMTGMRASTAGDWRLVMWDPSPREFGGFAWRHVLLLSTFVATYLVVRGKRLWTTHRFHRPSTQTLVMIVVLAVALTAYFYALHLYLGPAPSQYEGGTPAYIELPLVVQQVTNVLQIVRLTLKQALILVLLTLWPRRPYRWLLLAWLAVELLLSVVALEGRTGAIITLLTFITGYHLLVRPIRIRIAFLVGFVMLGGFLLFGLVRDLRENLRIGGREAVWGAPTEFQVLFGNAYDIHMRKVTHAMPEVPPQLYFSDFYRLVPSQLLPFQKWDPSVWYRDRVLELDNSMGFMFGIVAQCALGSNEWLELFTRGVLLALFFAAAHRAWRRYSGSFWATVAYLFILTWTYYAFRASSFEILYRLVYYLAPTALLVKLLTVLVSVPVRMTRRVRVVAH